MSIYGNIEDIAHTADELGVAFNKEELDEEQLRRIAALEAELNAAEKEIIAAPEEVSAEAAQIEALAKVDPDFLAAIAMPLVYEYPLPEIYLSLWAWLIDYASRIRDFSRMALGLPRGFGKTMLMKLFILYCILFTQKKFILVICENQAKANNILSDVIDMLNEPNIIASFGDWRLGIETDRLDLKKFGFRGRSIVLLAAGSESGIRGINLKNNRPDVMIFDDVQSRENADSKVQADKLEREIIGTAMKAKSPHGCLYLFVGNMYPTPYSILRKLKKNPTWLKFICGGITEKGESLWEELQPIKQLLLEYENDCSMGHPEIFHAEVLNDENASSNNLIDLSKLPALPFKLDDIAQGNMIIIDPSKGAVNSDDVAIGYAEVFDGYPCLIQVENGKFSPGDTIRIALKIALERNCRLIAIESVAYQATLGYWFGVICLQMGIIGIECVELYPGGHSKNARILNAFKSYSAGELFVAPSCQPIVHTQIIAFNPLKRDNIDDVLDLLAYMPKVLEMYGEFVQNQSILINSEHDEIEVLPAGANSPF